MQTSIAKSIGSIAASLAAFFAITYSAFQLLLLFKTIPHPDALFLLFLPSLLLAPAFLIAAICLHYTISADKKIYTAIGISFATLYAAFVIIVYFTQLAVIIPGIQRNTLKETHLLAFTDGSFMVAVNCMGYTFMNAATLFMAFAFGRNTKFQWLYRSLLLNGMLTPVMVAAFFIPDFLYVGALWMITFPMAMFHTAKLFVQPSQKSKIRTPHETTMLS